MIDNSFTRPLKSQKIPSFIFKTFSVTSFFQQPHANSTLTIKSSAFLFSAKLRWNEVWVDWQRLECEHARLCQWNGHSWLPSWPCFGLPSHITGSHTGIPALWMQSSRNFIFTWSESCSLCIWTRLFESRKNWLVRRNSKQNPVQEIERCEQSTLRSIDFRLFGSFAASLYRSNVKEVSSIYFLL